jgi:hypothetical protein
MKTITFGLFCVALALSVSTANAQGIDPRCAKMRDKVGCTCALQNGGYIKPTGGWASARKTSSGRPTNQAFTQCLINRGRS